MMKDKTWLSVIMPTWNGSAFLRDALESVTVQQKDDLEIIAVDDGSTDSTVDILESYSRKLPITLIRQPHTGNWVANTNLGISRASGKYISFLHQDDLWLPDRLKRLRWITDRHPETVLILHPSFFINAAGRRVGVWRCPLPGDQKPLSPADVFPKLLVQNFISIPGPCFQRKAAESAGLLDERLWYTADWKLWLQIASMGPSLYHPFPLSGFRIHPASQTAVGSVNQSGFRHQMQTVIDQFLPVLCETRNPDFRAIKQLAQFSLEVNTGMAAAARGQSFDFSQLLKNGFSLGPVNWRRYIKYSRIAERSLARIRAGLL